MVLVRLRSRARLAARPLLANAALVAVVLLVSQPAHPADGTGPAYTVEIIDPESLSRAWALGVNDRGDIVGEASYPDGTHALLWRNSTQVDLGADGEALAINIRGVVVGVQASRATRWYGGRTRVLDGTWAADVNEAGRIVGQRGDVAMRWFGTRSFRVKGLPGSNSDAAVGINDLGEIVGNSQVVREGSVVSRGFFRSPTGRLTELLPVLPDDTWTTVVATNNLGQSVGRESAPVRWGRSGHGVVLPVDFPAHDCVPQGLNDRGWAVGHCVWHGDTVAVAWDAAGRYIFLNYAIANQPITVTWWLAAACAINRQGWIVGMAYGYPGRTRPFVMKPVVPAAVP